MANAITTPVELMAGAGKTPDRETARCPLSKAAVALTDRLFIALDRALTRRLMEAMDERGRADIGWRRD